MLNMKRREFIALVGGGGLLLAVKVKRARGQQPAVPVAKAASSTIPIVFSMGGDPVALGYVASLSHPGGNLTGVTTLNVELGPKRVELMHELVPTTTVLGLLVNPTNFVQSEIQSRDMQAAARSVGLEIVVLRAST